MALAALLIVISAIGEVGIILVDRVQTLVQFNDRYSYALASRPYSGDDDPAAAAAQGRLAGATATGGGRNGATGGSALAAAALRRRTATCSTPPLGPFSAAAATSALAVGHSARPSAPPSAYAPSEGGGGGGPHAGAVAGWVSPQLAAAGAAGGGGLVTRTHSSTTLVPRMDSTATTVMDVGDRWAAAFGAVAPADADAAPSPLAEPAAPPPASSLNSTQRSAAGRAHGGGVTPVSSAQDLPALAAGCAAFPPALAAATASLGGARLAAGREPRTSDGAVPPIADDGPLAPLPRPPSGGVRPAAALPRLPGLDSWRPVAYATAKTAAVRVMPPPPPPPAPSAPVLETSTSLLPAASFTDGLASGGHAQPDAGSSGGPQPPVHTAADGSPEPHTQSPAAAAAPALLSAFLRGAPTVGAALPSPLGSSLSRAAAYAVTPSTPSVLAGAKGSAAAPGPELPSPRWAAQPPPRAFAGPERGAGARAGLAQRPVSAASAVGTGARAAAQDRQSETGAATRS